MDLLHIVDAEPPPSKPSLPGADFPIEELLLQLHDERQKARRRETVYISIILHACLVILLILNRNLLRSHYNAIPPPDFQQDQMTYLEMPKDLITPKKPVTPPKAISDQDRHFENPQKPQDSLVSPPMQPAPAPPAPPAQPNPNTGQSSPPPPPAAPPKPDDDNGPKLQNLPSPLRPNLHTLSATELLQQAIEDAAKDRATHGDGFAEQGQLPPPPGGNGAPGSAAAGAMILSDTQGVDFDPWLRRVVDEVRKNWYSVMPVAVYMGQKGRVVVVFNVMTNGTMPGTDMRSGSGTESLDQAAVAAIDASNPFPPLPSQFHGPFITLQFSFFYNEHPGDNGQ